METPLPDIIHVRPHFAALAAGRLYEDDTAYLAARGETVQAMVDALTLAREAIMPTGFVQVEPWTAVDLITAALAKLGEARGAGSR